MSHRLTAISGVLGMVALPSPTTPLVPNGRGPGTHSWVRKRGRRNIVSLTCRARNDLPSGRWRGSVFVL